MGETFFEKWKHRIRNAWLVLTGGGGDAAVSVDQGQYRYELVPNYESLPQYHGIGLSGRGAGYAVTKKGKARLELLQALARERFRTLPT